ncbi:MAG: hypothetical protein OEZ58_17600, partial [Gammaproteobacteria bacterium]|nr:hypothetical protein [Gammaproteobacteria bacterium]
MAKCRKNWRGILPTRLWLVLLLLVPLRSFALGVGIIDVQSNLDEPLVAEIPLLSVNADDIRSLSVTLADKDVFTRMGAEITPTIEQLQFDIEQNSSGEYLIKISTDKSVSEPFLNFLIEINWRDGRLTREFTVLLDPPLFEELIKESPMETPEAGAAPSFSVDESQAEPAMIPDADSSEPMMSTQQDLESTDTSFSGSSEFASQAHKVKAGEILWRIANEMRPDDVTIEQMMLALLRDNPEAFFGNNVSMLKAGAILRIKDRDSILRTSIDEAIAEVSRQHQDWMAYRRQVQGQRAVAAESTETLPEQAPARSGEMAELEQESQTSLTLVTPDPEDLNQDSTNQALDMANKEVESVRQELLLATEQMEVAQRRNEELQTRLASLEDQVRSMHKLLQLKDAQLKQLQAIKQKQGELTEEDQAILAQIEASTQQPMDLQVPLEEQTTQETDWSSDTLTLATIIGILLLVGLGAWGVTKQKAKSQKQAHQGLPELSEEVLAGEPLHAAEHDSVIESLTHDSAYDDAADVENNEGLGDIDPISEADVYIAYEKYDKAEELIKAAIESKPDRIDLQAKLLEIYYLMGNRGEFETQAQLVKTTLNKDDHPIWLRALEMGRELAPHHALFGGKGDAPVIAAYTEAVVGGGDAQHLTTDEDDILSENVQSKIDGEAFEMGESVLQGLDEQATELESARAVGEDVLDEDIIVNESAFVSSELDDNDITEELATDLSPLELSGSSITDADDEDETVLEFSNVKPQLDIEQASTSDFENMALDEDISADDMLDLSQHTQVDESTVLPETVFPLDNMTGLELDNHSALEKITIDELNQGEDEDSMPNIGPISDLNDLDDDFGEDVSESQATYEELDLGAGVETELDVDGGQDVFVSSVTEEPLPEDAISSIEASELDATSLLTDSDDSRSTESNVGETTSTSEAVETAFDILPSELSRMATEYAETQLVDDTEAEESVEDEIKLSGLDSAPVLNDHLSEQASDILNADDLAFDASNLSIVEDDDSFVSAADDEDDVELSNTHATESESNVITLDSEMSSEPIDAAISDEQIESIISEPNSVDLEPAESSNLENAALVIDDSTNYETQLAATTDEQSSSVDNETVVSENNSLIVSDEDSEQAASEIFDSESAIDMADTAFSADNAALQDASTHAVSEHDSALESSLIDAQEEDAAIDEVVEDAVEDQQQPGVDNIEVTSSGEIDIDLHADNDSDAELVNEHAAEEEEEALSAIAQSVMEDNEVQSHASEFEELASDFVDIPH